MGGKLSTSKQQECQEPDICEVDVLAEQEPRQAEIPPDVMDRRRRLALHRVVEVGDEAEVRQLLAVGASVHAKDDGGRTPLMVAASKGSAQLCGLLIDAGADVRARDSCGQTALHAAAVAEVRAPVVELLLRQGADPLTQDNRGRTALHCTLQSGNQASAEVLVPFMMPLIQQNTTGRTQLHWAAGKIMPQLVRQLIAGASGGDPGRDKAGVTPLSQELQARKRRTARIPVFEACDVFGRTVLHWAAYVGYPEVVRQLLERGFLPWVKDECGRDALIWAVERGVRTVVEHILQKAGYTECIDKKGQTALHVAAIRGDEAVVALLLHYEADAGRMDIKGRTPLMYALRGAHREVARLLATHGGATEHVRDHQKRTLLHWAAVGGDVSAVRKLLVHGAEVNALDSKYKSPAALAVEHRHQDVATVLLEADSFQVTSDCKGRTPLHGAAAAGWGQVALQLVSLGADPHEGGTKMLSPVQLAMRAGRYELAWDISRAEWR